MFKVKYHSSGNYLIADGNRNYMHCDGSIVFACSERWSTEKEAQTVLDKHRPKHVWKHGDVFDDGECQYPKIYIHIDNEEPQVFHLSGMYMEDGRGMPAYGRAEEYTCWHEATFLFNIKDKL